MSNFISADLAVIGAGPSGWAAALAAKRSGLKNVVVIEKRPFPGGMISCAGVHSMLTFHGLKGHKIIGGLPQELIDNLVSLNASTGHIRDTVGVAWSITPVSPPAVAAYFDSSLKEQSVMLLTDCELTGAVCENTAGFGKISSVKCVKGSSVIEVSAGIFVDASGEGVLGQLAQANLLPMKDGSSMPMTLIFNVGNVSIPEIIDYIGKNKTEFHHETVWDALESSPAIGVSGFFSLWKNAALSVPRDRILFYQTLGRDEVSINSTRVLVAENSSDATLPTPYSKGLSQVNEVFAFLRKSIPGFSKSFISYIPPFIGIREGRRIKGMYSLSGSDVLNGRRFADEIAFGGFPIDIHSPTGKNLESISLKGDGFYGIPYRSIVSENIKNLFVIGKCFSAEFEAHASARVQASSMAMGQAAGTAGAICCRDGILPQELDVSLLREKLFYAGVILSPEISGGLH